MEGITHGLHPKLQLCRIFFHKHPRKSSSVAPKLTNSTDHLPTEGRYLTPHLP